MDKFTIIANGAENRRGKNQAVARKIADYLDECKFDRVLLAGEEFGKVIPSFEHFKDVVALKESLERYKPKGYYILIKGSNSMKLAQLQEIL